MEHNTVGLAPKPQDLLEADGSVRFRPDHFATSPQDASISCELQDNATSEATISYECQAASAVEAAIHIRPHEQGATDGATTATDEDASSAANIAHLLPAKGTSCSARDGEPLTERDYEELENISSPNLLKVMQFIVNSN